MGNAAAKRSQQQAIFIGAFEKLVSELEGNGFITALIEEADDPEWCIRTEQSKTAELAFIVYKGQFSALTITFRDQQLPKLDLSIYQQVVFGGDDSGKLVLTDEQCDALFEAFLDECRRLFRRHRIRLSKLGKRFFLPE